MAFIIPTLKRSDFLRRCLAAIRAQTTGSASVLVGVRSDDAESLPVVAEFQTQFPVRAVEAKGVGVIGSMSSCLAETAEEFVALVDDDVELPPHWLQTMHGHLRRNPDVLAAAGRDLLQDHPQMRRTEERVMDVGGFHWYGRITGNHHRGAGEPRRVDILRGSNMLLRGAFLREVGFEQRLRGRGAQVNWELALAFQAMQRERRFFYDPNVEVIHHVAPRHGPDSLHRGGFNVQATYDSAFNEMLVIACHAPPARKWTALLYQGVVGSPLAPGVLHFVRQALAFDRNALPRARATISARLAALDYSKNSYFQSP